MVHKKAEFKTNPEEGGDRFFGFRKEGHCLCPSIYRGIPKRNSLCAFCELGEWRNFEYLEIRQSKTEARRNVDEEEFRR